MLRNGDFELREHVAGAGNLQKEIHQFFLSVGYREARSGQWGLGAGEHCWAGIAVPAVLETGGGNHCQPIQEPGQFAGHILGD
jgi:hypothetical protein